VHAVDRLPAAAPIGAGNQLETFEVGKDKLKIIAIEPQMPEKAAYDLSLPRLSPILVRKKTLAEEIETLEVMSFRFSPDPLPRKPTDADIKKFQYEAFDVITMEKLFQREYAIQDPQRPDEIVSYYAKLIASNVKLPSQFSALAPKIWTFFERRAFGEQVDMYSPAIIQAMNHRVSGYVVLDVFAQRGDVPFKPEDAPDVVRSLLVQLVQKVPGPAHRTGIPMRLRVDHRANECRRQTIGLGIGSHEGVESLRVHRVDAP